MKTIHLNWHITISLICLTICSASVNAQVHHVFPDHCKKKNIEITTADDFPKDVAIMQMGTFPIHEVGGTLGTLTKSQIKKMKKVCYWNNCCEVFVAFDQIQTFKGYDHGPDFYKNYVCFYVIAPSKEVELLKQ